MKKEDFLKKWKGELITAKNMRKKVLTREVKQELDSVINTITLMLKDAKKIKYPNT